MPFPSDGESPSSGPCSKDRSDASQQRSKPLEGESSRTGELSAPMVQRAYNLRPRYDDQGRWQYLRSAEQKPKKRRKRMEYEALRQTVNETPEERHADSENWTEIINAGSAVEMENWRPYFLPPDIGLFKTTLKGASWETEKFALQAAPYVVGLKSLTVGNKYLFSCSGTIIKSSEKIQQIVTVANLVKKDQDADEVADGLKIDVYLQNNRTCTGNPLYHDFHYNICVIEIECPLPLPEKGFSSQEAINIDKNCSRDVVALGRDNERHALSFSTGKIIPKNSMFDCEELLVSTCRISKAAVGGPLMDMDGDFIGMNYYHNKETPFIPSFIVLKCVQQFKLSGKVVKPWHGLQVRTFYAEGCDAFEKIDTNVLRESTGVIIEKIRNRSLTKASGLKEGDVINQINGVYFSNAAELGGILLDFATEHLLDPSFPLIRCIKFGAMDCDNERTVRIEPSTPGGFINRWPFPTPIIVKKYVDRKLADEEWYAMEP